MNEQTSEKLKKLALKNAEQQVTDERTLVIKLQQKIAMLQDDQDTFAEIEELLKIIRNQRQEALTRLAVANAELAKLQGLIGDLV